MFPQALVLTSLLAQAYGQITYSYDKIESSRAYVNVLPYSAAERRNVSIALQNVFKIYVNEESKLKTYSGEYPNIDPKPRIDAIAAKAENLTNYDFNSQISSVFLSLRDFHTQYYMPGMHQCLVAYKAVSFGQAWERETPTSPLTKKVFVSGYSTVAAIKTLSPGYEKAALGDDLIAIDGIPTSEYFESRKFKTGGAGPAGSFSATLSSLSLVSGRFGPLPTADSNEFTFKSAKNGEIYKVTLPWILRRQDDCVANAKRVNAIMGEPFVTPFKLDSSEIVVEAPAATQPRPVKYQGENPNIELFKEAFSVGDIAAVPLITSAERIVKYAIYKPKNLGIIRLDSFSPTLDTYPAIELIRGLLINELKDTDALLFDIRANGGGSIEFANFIPQLFKARFVSAGARALVNEVNAAIFNNPGLEDWAAAVANPVTGTPYSQIVYFTTPAEDNTYGMAYLKPVGIITDGNCYSACSLFSSAMQDVGAAIIYGEDVTTGGGGANVVQWSSTFNKLAPSYFPPPPYFQEFAAIASSRGAPDIRLGWRQTVRLGKNAGEIIEDRNVISDKIISPARAELTGTPGNIQLDKIAEDLKRQAFVTGQKSLILQTVEDINSESEIGTQLSFNVTSSGIRKIAIKDASGKVLGETNVALSKIYKTTTYSANYDASVTATGFYRFFLYGYDLSGAEVIASSRYVVALPNKSAYGNVVAGSGFAVDILGSPTYAGQYDKSAPGLGWNKAANSLIIGDGKQYVDSVNTEIKYFLNINGPTKVTLVANYDTELDYDYFFFGYSKDGEETQFLTSVTSTNVPVDGVSGVGEINQTFDLPAGTIRLFIKFVSDGGVTSRGVEVKSIAIA